MYCVVTISLPYELYLWQIETGGDDVSVWIPGTYICTEIVSNAAGNRELRTRGRREGYCRTSCRREWPQPT